MCSGPGSDGGLDCVPVEQVGWWTDVEGDETSGCGCINGNFCCSSSAYVPGGQNPADYYNDVGCNCNG